MSPGEQKSCISLILTQNQNKSRYGIIHVMKFKTAILAIISVVVVHFIAGFSGIYETFESFDIPMHFFGGFALAMLAIAANRFYRTKHKPASQPLWHSLIFVLGFVMIISVLWEFMEFTLDATLGTHNQLGLFDTMKDLFMGLLGSPFGYWLGKKQE